MSVKCMARVWADSSVGGSELLVLLAIADHAHDDGSGAWPSLATIARKTKLSKRQVSRIIDSLVAKQELERESGGGPYGTNAYVVLSGLTPHNPNGLQCYLCGTPDDGDTRFEEHHPDPENRDHTVLLCKTCHIKVHKLLGIDKMSIPTDSMDTMSTPMTPCPQHGEKDGQNVHTPIDTMTGVVTSRDESIDIATSTKPSLTVNSQSSLEPSEDLSLLWTPILDDLQRQMVRGTFDTYLRGSQLLTADNGTWTVQVPDPYAVDWLDNRLRTVIDRTVDRHAPGVRVTFVCSNDFSRSSGGTP